jgi:hypothetical protein
MDEAHERAPMPAVRLIFEYEGDEVRLVSQQPVDVAVPGFDLAQPPHPGHYVEARTADDEPLSRVSIREAFSTSMEVFPEEPGEPITRTDVEQVRGAFTVIVPAGSEATHVALLEVRPAKDLEAPRPGARATTPTPSEPEVVEIASFPLGSERAQEESDGDS